VWGQLGRLWEQLEQLQTEGAAEEERARAEEAVALFLSRLVAQVHAAARQLRHLPGPAQREALPVCTKVPPAPPPLLSQTRLGTRRGCSSSHVRSGRAPWLHPRPWVTRAIGPARLELTAPGTAQVIASVWEGCQGVQALPLASLSLPPSRQLHLLRKLAAQAQAAMGEARGLTRGGFAAAIDDGDMDYETEDV
jgi:hypothetical protein